MSDLTKDFDRVGVVHLGLGAFFRAFGLPQLQRMQAQLGADHAIGWDVIGISLRSAGVRDLLAQNGFRYHAVEMDAARRLVEEITILKAVYFLEDERREVLNALLLPHLNMVTLTITEKGYCYSPALSGLDWEHPQIRQDLITPETPSSVPGLLVQALRHRRALGLNAFTCLSCDNLSENGRVLQTVVLEFAQKIDPDLAQWIKENVRFPATMVDRIVPAVTAQDVEDIAALTCWPDPAPVLHEPFWQWVIEEDFADLPRPPLELVGVEFTSSVRSFEEMKLRLLNATHSSIAYLCVLTGYETVFDAMQNTALAAFIKRLWEHELRPSFTPPPGQDLKAYTQALERRYRNSAIAHATLQIAMDGSQKLPQRVLAPLRANLAANRRIDGLCLVVAAWILFLNGQSEAGVHYVINDPLQPRLSSACAQKQDPVGAVLSIAEIFGSDLKQDARFEQGVRQAYARLRISGVLASVELACQHAGKAN